MADADVDGDDVDDDDVVVVDVDRKVTTSVARAALRTATAGINSAVEAMERLLAHNAMQLGGAPLNDRRLTQAVVDVEAQLAVARRRMHSLQALLTTLSQRHARQVTNAGMLALL